jgi:3-oxoacyl-[acyl-carrier-protein] synthase-3
MAESVLQQIALKTMAAAVPIRVRLNSEIGADTERDYVERLSLKVGVDRRHVVCEGQSGTDLAVAAVMEALKCAGWNPDSIDLLVVGTQTPDQLFPGNSFRLHQKLGLSKKCVVFDVNLGCSAFTHGLWITGNLLRSCGKRAALVNVDLMSRTLGSTDTGNQVLFGDAATAVFLELDESAQPSYFCLGSDGNGVSAVLMPNSACGPRTGFVSEFKINGPAVLGMALRDVPPVIAKVLALAGISGRDVNLFVPHQANMFILRKLLPLVGIPEDKTLFAMENFGNTSAASIPLSIVANSEVLGKKSMNHVLFAGFGTGFSISSSIVNLTSTRFGKVVFV